MSFDALALHFMATNVSLFFFNKCHVIVMGIKYPA